MTAQPRVKLERAVAAAVRLVNAQPGQTSVHLRFAFTDPAEFDFVANSARLENGQFTFNAGYETYRGSVTELADIRTEVIPQ